jgi:uncharacterized peroxidase-related enzyme
MAWITVIEENEATAELDSAYSALKGKRGKLANIMKVHSLNPRAMQTHMDLYLTLMFAPSGLTREERELIAVVVSAANSCDYCVHHHAEALNHYWKDREKIARVIEDFHSAELPDKAVIMLSYAVKLTQKPEAMNQDDVEALRSAGFVDEDILNINLITSYFNFVNRIALGLGVGFSEEEMTGYRY